MKLPAAAGLAPGTTGATGARRWSCGPARASGAVDLGRVGDGSMGRVVSLVTDGLGDGVATLYVNGEPLARSRGDHGSLERPVPLPAEAPR